MVREVLFGKTLNEIIAIVQDIGMPKFTAKQITQWLYKHEISSIDDMTNISAKNREILKSKYDFGLSKPVKVQESIDGTKKYLFPVHLGYSIETAMIPDKERVTVCVSSQVGCKMGCEFCMTARQGFHENLTAGEIINQIRSIDEFTEVSNIVYMGMGEPFDNIEQVLKSLEILTSDWGYSMSPKRITVSSIGIIPGMKEFLTKSNCHLAISMHTPFHNERQELMPVQKAYPLIDVLNEIRSFDFGLQRRVSFEYIMFEGVNDSQEHINELAKILKGIKCRINLIAFHPIPNSRLKGSDINKIQLFKDSLNAKGILTTVRASRGQDIFAACGLLSTSESK